MPSFQEGVAQITIHLSSSVTPSNNRAMKAMEKGLDTVKQEIERLTS